MVKPFKIEILDPVDEVMFRERRGGGRNLHFNAELTFYSGSGRIHKYFVFLTSMWI